MQQKCARCRIYHLKTPFSTEAWVADQDLRVCRTCTGGNTQEIWTCARCKKHKGRKEFATRQLRDTPSCPKCFCCESEREEHECVDYTQEHNAEERRKREQWQMVCCGCGQKTNPFEFSNTQVKQFLATNRLCPQRAARREKEQHAEQRGQREQHVMFC